MFILIELGISWYVHLGEVVSPTIFPVYIQTYLLYIRA